MPTLTLADAAIGQQDYGTGLAPTDERDPISAAYVAAGDAFATDYVLAGANFITDFGSAANGIFNVTAGTALLTIDPADVGMTAFAVQTDPGDETSYDIDWNGPVALPISIPQSPDLELEAGVNQVYLTVDPTQNNNVAIEWGTTVDPAGPRLLLGSLDTDTETTTLASREPDLEAGALVATSVDADALTIEGQAVATEAYADQAGFSGSYLDLTDVPTTFAPEDHALAGSAHTASTLTNLNTIISDATLDDSSAERPPEAHELAAHTASTLAALNTIISDATLDDAGSSRPPETHGMADHDSSVAASEDLFSGNHGDLTGVSSSQHHAKYTDAEAVGAVTSEDPLSLDNDIEIPDATVVYRDLEANRTNHTPHDGAVFIATDSGAVYDGDGVSWAKATRDTGELNGVKTPSNAAEIKEALDTNASDGDRIHIPPGEHVVDNPIEITDDITIRGGVGRRWGKTTLKKSNDANLLEIKGGSSCTIRDLALEGLDTGDTTAGIKTFKNDQADRLYFDTVRVMSMGSHGLDLDSCNISTFISVESMLNDGNGVDLGPDGLQDANATTWINTNLQSNGGHGWHCHDSYGHTVIGGYGHGNDGFGYVIASNGSTFLNIGGEANVEDDVHVTSEAHRCSVIAKQQATDVTDNSPSSAIIQTGGDSSTNVLPAQSITRSFDESSASGLSDVDPNWEPHLFTHAFASREVAQWSHIGTTATWHYPFIASSDRGLAATIQADGDTWVAGDLDADGRVKSDQDSYDGFHHYRPGEDRSLIMSVTTNGRCHFRNVLGDDNGATGDNALILHSDASVEVPNDFDVGGNKNFVHDLGDGTEAVYTAQESADVRAVLEGTVHVDGETTVELPDHYDGVTEPDDSAAIRVQVTPRELATVACTERSTTELTFDADAPVDVDYRVTAIREGRVDKQVVREHNRGNRPEEPPERDDA